MKHRILLIFSALLLFGLSSGAIVTAQSQPSKIETTGLTPTNYGTDRVLRAGTVVQADEKDASKVVPATHDKLPRAFGLVVKRDSLPITISDATADGHVLVATAGRHQALVTTENGVIAAGDALAVSSLSGTLMKADTNQELIFGKALASFSGKDNVISSTTLKDNKGKPLRRVQIGTVPVAIDITKNPYKKSTKVNLPEPLQRVGFQIADKPVTPVKFIVSVIIMIISIIIAVSLLYVGVRSSIISVGRNPLSRKSVLKALMEVILTSVLILIIGLFAVYLLLRL